MPKLASDYISACNKVLSQVFLRDRRADRRRFGFVGLPRFWSNKSTPSMTHSGSSSDIAYASSRYIRNSGNNDTGA